MRKNCGLLSILPVLVGLLQPAPGDSAQARSWCDSFPPGSQWNLDPLFGWMYTPECPWVFIDGKGWFYSDGPFEPNRQQWIGNVLNGWFWTDENAFPYLWSDLRQEWVLFGDLTLTTGTVQTGGNAAFLELPGATVDLYRATGNEAPALVASWTSDANGQFAFATPFPQDGGIYYFTADFGNGVRLAAVPGGEVPLSFIINELTTVATAYAYAQLFAEDGTIRAEPLALRIAAGMSGNLVDIGSGSPSAVMLNTPNADETNSLRSTRNLANLIAASVGDPEGANPGLFALTTPPGGPAPSDTLQALVNLARHPANFVDEIFSRSLVVTPYTPTLQFTPDAWTLAVKVNDTGSVGIPFGGVANTVFDDRGYAWINNNVVQGQPISATSVVVLQPDGRPSDGTNGTPLSPITGGGILGPGFGIARSPVDGTIWVGNFGWGGLNPGPTGTGTGSVSQIALDGTPLSPEDGYDGGTNRVQGIILDPDGNVWTANFGGDEIVVFIGGDPDNAVSAELKSKPFGLALGTEGTVWAATVGNEPFFPFGTTPGEVPSNVTRWRLNEDQTALERLFTTNVGKELKGLDVDFDGYAWVASGGDDTVYRLAPDGSVVGTFRSGGINAPWSIRIDDAGEVWVANFGPMSFLPGNTVYRNAGVTKLAGPDSPSGLPVGTPLSPDTGFTLPSAGAPVLINVGSENPVPLDQVGNQPAFTPLMRPVSTVPDRAGNLWVSNNWKPNFASNVLEENPGGTGLVIFIGLAAPTQPGRTQ